MKIHSMCIVKNESDIIEQTLKAAIKWSDFIYVLDNGSTDGSWEKVLNLAEAYKQIIPYKQDDCPFNLALFAEIFYHYRSNTSDGDWWCRLDADEIYIDDPRTFLSQVHQKYQAVWNASITYYFTDKDLELYNQDPSLYADDVPVEEKFRYYFNRWSEARFFRYDRNLVWDRDQSWPYFGAVYPVRIRLKHYQYRSPEQIQKRINTRILARQRGSDRFKHEVKRTLESDAANLQKKAASAIAIQLSGDEWKGRIQEASQFNYDNQDGNYVLNEDLMPKLPSVHPTIANRMRILKRYARALKKLIAPNRS
ncbi:glycosyl transferase [Nostoc sp. PCC 7524]|uniref:glycosyltransferase family 2 protein n=1 Tax=Nostoc sp. (strain ATCC 29411 / PCC 7524) TaxID=28072 RepID=UPI00029F1463|nr:glycosyltransferase family 2 protein [Nostoc sp. PCC 7524]AFY50749.1 glycosyl transferase [Nostoc sp. PCC 7524]